MAFRFRSFRSRLLVFVVGLLILVHGAVLLAVHAANLRGARQHVDETLALTAAAFRRSLQARERSLVEKARLLASDFAFKRVAATGDRATILSALENHSARVGADVMMLLEPSGDVLADVLGLPPRESATARRALVAEAMEDAFGEASSIQLLGGTPHQIVMVPLLTPDPSGWIVVGFAVDDALARELQEETGTHVSLLRLRGGGWSAFTTTLPGPVESALEEAIPKALPSGIVSLSLAGKQYVLWMAAIDEAGMPLAAVLQRSLDEALEPFMQLRSTLLAIFLVGVLVSLAGSALVAARVTRPVAVLARGARRIEQGDYTDPVSVRQDDELGALASSFNAMMKGLAERDQVRDLLGRVVAPEIAEELLSKEITLGGEVRRVTVLFTDVRDFTALAEDEEPQRLVRILNTFLTAVSRAVEGHGGVVEEYMGDGAKALFGAPVSHTDDALRAVRAALDLTQAMPKVNAELAGFGAGPVRAGIGVHTADVVAGRMGSLSRLKYTVVGDGVNLASRLEGLTRLYGVPVVVSGATRAQCPGLVFRELDRVRVQGRDEPVDVYEPLGATDELAPEVLERVARHEAALALFRAQAWEGAAAAFERIRDHEPQARLPRLFLERIEALRRDPPGPDWSGTLVLREK